MGKTITFIEGFFYLLFSRLKEIFNEKFHLIEGTSIVENDHFIWEIFIFGNIEFHGFAQQV